MKVASIARRWNAGASHILQVYLHDGSEGDPRRQWTHVWEPPAPLAWPKSGAPEVGKEWDSTRFSGKVTAVAV